MAFLIPRLAGIRFAPARVLGVAVIALGTVTAAHAQSSIGDCEKITAADAYNQCLAKFGPPSKAGNLEPERPGDVKGSSEEAAAAAGPAKGARKAGKVARRGRHGRGGGHARRGGGRKRATFTIRRHR